MTRCSAMLPSVQSVLAFNVTASSPNVMLLARGNEVVPPFKLDITVAGDGKLSASVGGDSNRVHGQGRLHHRQGGQHL